MPHLVINQIKFCGAKGAEALKKHLVLTEEGSIKFDFNTVLPMPEELNISHSTNTSDGFNLYLTSICPFVSYYGNKEDKISEKEFETFMNNYVDQFHDHDCLPESERYVYSEERVKQTLDSYRRHYKTPEEQEEIINLIVDLGKQAYNNYIKYGYATWYEWRFANWGCKWNSDKTRLIDDNTVEFQTPNTHPDHLFMELIKQHPDVDFEITYSENEPGCCSGCWHTNIAENAAPYIKDCVPYSKEAYDIYYKLWKGEKE